MSIPLADLIPPLKAACNAPGGTLVVALDEEWRAYVVNGFWSARLRGYFRDYRLNPAANSDITPVPPVEDDLSGELQYLVVLLAAVDILELKFAELDALFRAKSGDQEFEVQKSALLLSTIIKARRLDLDTLYTNLVLKPYGGKYVGVIDLATARLGAYGSRVDAWIDA